MNIQKFLDISTGHMQRHDDELLTFEVDTPASSFPLRVIGHDYGYWVRVPLGGEDVLISHVNDLLELGFSDDFINLLKAAAKEGCWWINFDCDADTVENFPLFNW